MKEDFDIAALSYDVSFTHSNIGIEQRKQVYQYLDTIISTSKKLNVLELNCGTGYDANYIANKHHKVLATDISEQMISVATSKYKADNLNFKVQDIRSLKTNFSPSYDLIFSDFGGFNCLDKKDIKAFFKKAFSLLNPEGRIVLVIMPYNTLWEKLYFSLKGDFKKATRRKKDTFTFANVSGVPVKTWYYNSKDIKGIATNFSVRKVRPIGLWVPPSYLENSILGKPWMLSILVKLDKLFKSAVFSKYSDHYYIELEKKRL